MARKTADCFWFDGGFYPPDHPNIPTGAVPLTGEERQALLIAQNEGAQLATDAKGRPVAIAPMDRARADAIASVKAEARRRIEAVMPLHKQINALRAGADASAEFARIDAIRAASNLIEADIADSADPSTLPIASHPLWPSDESLTS